MSYFISKIIVIKKLQSIFENNKYEYKYKRKDISDVKYDLYIWLIVIKVLCIKYKKYKDIQLYDFTIFIQN